MTYAEWLRSMSERGGKGVVNNIDARSLGRAADELDALRNLADRAYSEIAFAVHDLSGRRLDTDEAIEGRAARLAWIADELAEYLTTGKLKTPMPDFGGLVAPECPLNIDHISTKSKG